MPLSGSARPWSLGSRTRRPVLPRSMGHLSNEMVMKRLLKEIYDTDYSEVESMVVQEKGSKPGDITGNLSDSGRVEVKLLMTSGEKVVHNWFVKILPKQHRNSELMHKFNIFENEIEFYRDTAPGLLNFLKKNGVEDVQFDIPKMLFSDSTEEGAVIILEDVCEQGFGQERDSEGGRYLSLERASLALDSLARLQAASLLHTRYQDDEVEEKNATLSPEEMWGDKEFLDRLTVMKDTYCQILSQSEEHDSDKLLERFQKTFDSGPRLKEVCAERYAPKNTGAVYLQHGDFHFNNLLFKEEQGVVEVMLVDWQLTYTGRSTGDVSYLLLSSVSPDVRRKHEQELKEAYFYCFNSYLKSFEASVMEHQSESSDSDSESDGEVDVEDLEQDYQDSATLSLFLSCGNVLSDSCPGVPEEQWEQATLSFAYSLVKDAATMEII